MGEQKSAQGRLPQPLRAVASTLRRVPGAGTVNRAAETALDRIGAVSPRGRRMAVYTGAGVLGVVGVVEWPVALTGAAVAWLTQPRPQERAAGRTRLPADARGGMAIGPAVSTRRGGAGSEPSGGTETSSEAASRHPEPSIPGVPAGAPEAGTSHEAPPSEPKIPGIPGTSPETAGAGSEPSGGSAPRGGEAG
ncbi:hypothetical protein GCM10010129_10100 [Streptomyces fumigatiscleroticus]|nr:hypothetical protein GCM10010129_10100 [Streptomyces fumigatiscleroticus]